MDPWCGPQAARLCCLVSVPRGIIVGDSRGVDAGSECRSASQAQLPKARRNCRPAAAAESLACAGSERQAYLLQQNKCCDSDAMVPIFPMVEAR
jgi:hypothetical protein